MPVLSGYSQVQYVQGPAGAPAQATGPNTVVPTVIDGTPIRVVGLALAGAAGLAILRWSGFRFNVGISS